LPRYTSTPFSRVQGSYQGVFAEVGRATNKTADTLRGQAGAGAILSPGHAWIAPGNFHMQVIHAGVCCRLNLNQGPPENSCRPAVDVLFRSVALAYGPNVLGVVMTGMGSDGVLGAQDIRDAGGNVIIQDEACSVVWGMPGLVHASGLADAAYPLDRLASQITRRVRQSRRSRAPLDFKSYSTLERHAT
jgi:two-component system, chemotaxis family, protein-glutamate methylesterase/glutaminase